MFSTGELVLEAPFHVPIICGKNKTTHPCQGKKAAVDYGFNGKLTPVSQVLDTNHHPTHHPNVNLLVQFIHTVSLVPL